MKYTGTVASSTVAGAVVASPSPAITKLDLQNSNALEKKGVRDVAT